MKMRRWSNDNHHLICVGIMGDVIADGEGPIR